MARDQLASLLERVEGLPAPQREVEVAKFACYLSDDDRRDVIATLDVGSPYERHLADIVGSATLDANWIASAIADPSPHVHHRALKVAKKRPALVPDSIFEAALEDATAEHRKSLLKAIDGRPLLADKIIDNVRRDWGDETAAALLGSCSPPKVAALLPDLVHAVRHWRVLARSHSETVLSVLYANWKTTEMGHAVWWRQYSDGIAFILQHSQVPDTIERVFEMIEHDPYAVGYSVRARLNILARFDLTRFIELYISHGAIETETNAFIHRLARAHPPNLVPYLKRFSRRLGDVLESIAPSARPSLFEAVTEGQEWPPPDERINTWVLTALPQEYVIRLVPKLVDRYIERKQPEDDILELRSCLPFAEAAEVLLAETRKPDAMKRRNAWGYYVNSVCRTKDPRRVTALVQLLSERLKNERIGVRKVALQQLTWIPAKLFSVESLPHLALVLKDAAEAPDTPFYEVKHRNYFILSILCEHPSSEPHREFAINSFRDPDLADASYYGNLRKGEERDLYTALAPLLDSDESHSLLFDLTRALGSRAQNVPELQAALWEAAQAKSRDTAQNAIELYLKPNATKSVRVEQVLKMDPSAMTLPSVMEIVCTSRTDLLIFSSPPKGLFFTEKYPSWFILPPSPHAVRRWTARQQAAYLSLLESVASDQTPLNPTTQTVVMGRRKSAAKLCGSVPGGEAVARKLCDGARSAEDSGNTELCEAALRGLSASPNDLPFLLSFAGTDRARVAVYAGTKCSLFVEPSVLQPLLSMLLSRREIKVTSRKEAARLVASRLPAPLAASILLPLVKDEQTHRDVCAACVTFATLRLLNTEAGWDILNVAAASSDSTAHQALLGLTPIDVHSSHRHRYAALVCDLVRSDDEEVSSSALRALVQWMPYAPTAIRIFQNILLDLETSGRYRSRSASAAVKGIFESAKRGNDALLTTVQRLIDLGSQAQDSGNAAYGLVNRLVDLTIRSSLIGVKREMSALLRNHDPLVHCAAEILVSTLCFGSGELDLLRDIASLCEARPLLANQLRNKIEYLAQEYTEKRAGKYQTDPSESDALLSIVQQLSEGSFAECFFAYTITNGIFEAIHAESIRAPWIKGWREQLRMLKTCKYPDVRDLAARICDVE